MVLTAHFIDSQWKLNKRVINFVHLPPPRRGVEIVDCIFKCVKEWGIENKIYTLSVDNASNNDSAIRILKHSFSRNKKLLCGDEARVNNAKVRAALYEIFDEYVAEYNSGGTEQGVETQVYGIGTKDANLKGSSSGWGEYTQFLKTTEAV
ncbi:hypothetical protein COLO4_23970 [Corchorus olitorius]|uniref:Uncharacterized protein n=1 Tax=Corchorus olitorius TaxID=93759 RepID=A0A1R3IDQ6_9ROSI|nr:hypothetical protein COLO4_23970 [Corchorus olitorius]